MTTPLIEPPRREGSVRFDCRTDLSRFIAFQDERAWAPSKAMLFPKLSVFHSLIPKNACTSILAALARANGLTTPGSRPTTGSTICRKAMPRSAT
jgi:hypothetical protein